MEVEFSENSMAVSGKTSTTIGREPLLPANANAGKGKSIEEIYQKKSQLEHILLRPDTYIGSTEKQQQQMWVYQDGRMVLKAIAYVPGLYKIFDEILVNAADNKARDPSMDLLKVDINADTNTITVWNNGNGVPVDMHKEENVYVPELIFGHLLTSSNYDDNEKKVTGGRNGYGAKLANIFSTQFTIETCDGSRQRRYKQTFTANMTKKGAPKITSCKATDNWTCVSFAPDLSKFGMDHLEEDTVALMCKRVYDLAGVLGKTVKVHLNGSKLPIKSFTDYVELYLGPKDNGVARVYERFNDRWEVCVSMTDGQFQQVSFVNSICTYKGGTHVDYITNQITKQLCEQINKKNKQANVKPFMVKNYLWVFVNSLIENPAFDSQTKENLTLRASSFGSKCELSDAYLKKVANCGIMDQILSFASYKQSKELKKSDGSKRQRITGIPKLDDANDAGGRCSEQCTLILTEGDSAKALAISGLSVVGRDRYGVFPLRGKLLNVRDASATQITNNTEIQHIKQILGLQHGKQYDNAKQLRYGHLMIMTDQDHDGSHIKGLIMNFFHHFYPSLLKMPGFLVEFITPIIKATKGNQTLSFYTMPEYEQWREDLGGSTRGWKIKYYKGLGTSTSKEAKEYFAAIAAHRKEFVWQDEEDSEALVMAFSKKKIEERKQWLASYQQGTFLDHTADSIAYREFVHKELILFSRADLERSIPSMVDGLKPGQRKIMFSCFKRNLKSDVKVAQLAGYVSEHSAYHHGEASLAATIVGLAQDFVGSNNVNLLVPSGQFGTRLQGGKDAASPRYIFTRMSPITRHLFDASDDPLLAYLTEEGQLIEPEWYMPILPLVLVNGAEGIGTGWSTFVPNYNPRDIVDNLKRLMAGQEPVPMEPWYKGFHGTLEEVATKTAGKSYAIHGCVDQPDDLTLHITELPVRKWTQDYKELLESMIKPEDKNDVPLLVDYKEHHTDSTVDFTLSINPTKAADLLSGDVKAKLKLTTKISCGNMVLFDRDGKIKRYESPEHILVDFYGMRLEFYSKRKAALLKTAEAELKRISNKVRFIIMVVEGQIVLAKRRKAQVEEDLQSHGFDRLLNKAAAVKASAAAPTAVVEDDDEGDEEGAGPAGASYDYLLSMALSSLTLEKVAELQREAQQNRDNVERLKGTTEKQMWTDDLDAFLATLDAIEAAEAEQAAHLVKQQQRARGGQKTARRKNADSSDEGDWRPKAAVKRAPPRAQLPPPGPAARPKAAANKASNLVVVEKEAPKGRSQEPGGRMAQTGSEVAPLAAVGAKPTTSELSLGARLAGRMAGLNLKSSSASVGAGDEDDGEAPQPVASKGTRPGRKASKMVIIDESDEEVGNADDKDEVSSPYVPPQPAAAAAKAKAGPSRLNNTKPTASAPASRPVQEKAAAKRKPGPKGTIAAAKVEAEPASPAVTQQGKVRRIRPSPFHKGSGQAGASKIGAIALSDHDTSDEDMDSAAPAAVPVARPTRRAVAVVKPAYVDLVDTEDEEEEAEDGSDFDPDSD